MAEECWCGKELEAVPSGGNPQEFDGAAECSIHGAKYRARPCLCATDYEDGHKRRCSVGGGFDMMAVVAQERFCAACPIPALVEALDRAIGICQAGFNTCEECPVKKPGGCMYLDAKRALGEMEVT